MGYRYYEVEDWRYLSKYTTSPNDYTGIKLDYALVKLTTKIDYDQFLEITIPCEACLKEKQQPLEIYGFPDY